MKQEYKQAFTEVYEIFKLMPKELLSRIPNKFIEMIEEERDKEYYPKIQEPIENQKLKNETIIILGLIYRDFLCDAEEKKRLQEKDAREMQKVQQEIEREMREKYNPDNIFKNRQTTKQETTSTSNYQTQHTEMIKYQEQKWYQKIFNIIKGIFKLRR